MFQKSFFDYFPNAQFLGYIDKVKEGEGIHRLDDITSTSFDAILILSQNHFDAIYQEYLQKLPASKLIKIDIQDNRYLFLKQDEIRHQRRKALPQKLRMRLLKWINIAIDLLHLPRGKLVFIAKGFVGGNTKMLFLHASNSGQDAILLTDNDEQAIILREAGHHVVSLFSLRAIWHLAFAKHVVQDQGNHTEPLLRLSDTQQTHQMWHGVPLKRMNRLTNITYDTMISTSDYVNETSLSDVVVAKQYLDLGYPRNDLLLKEHTSDDLLLCDQGLYNFAKSRFGTASKVIVYMPTHREASTEIESPETPLMPLDFQQLEETLESLDAYLIVKLHPFVMQFFENFAPEEGFKHILFHSAQGDIYPILKYTDILITDYSSVYFDFLLLDRPIIFFDYDYEEYSSNMDGFVYDYEAMAPGPKASDQASLIKCLEQAVAGGDEDTLQRHHVRDLFYTHQDARSSERILTEALT
jgi:CDP-glycerol glycerophosphotransferase (TagB/SpsB family)